MGMFDYVEHDGIRYQTKDTPDQSLSVYRIVNGRLIGDEWHYVDTPESELPYAEELKDPNLSESRRAWLRCFGSLKRIIDSPNVDQNWHGYLHLIRNEPPLHRFRAKFTDGKLVAFELLAIQESAHNE